MRQPIKNWTGRIVGFIEEDTIGNKTVYDFYGKILGKYDKKLNITKDFYGKQIAKGDAVMSFINFNN